VQTNHMCDCPNRLHIDVVGTAAISFKDVEENVMVVGCFVSFDKINKSHILAGNVADMSRHVGDDTTCRSNFGQMGPCRRHKI
jgi:hypothetical protein